MKEDYIMWLIFTTFKKHILGKSRNTSAADTNQKKPSIKRMSLSKDLLY